MHPADIKAELEKKNVTAAAIADELGVSRTAVSNVIKGTTRSDRIRKHIAQVINKSVNSIWAPTPSLRRTSAEIRRSA